MINYASKRPSCPRTTQYKKRPDISLPGLLCMIRRMRPATITLKIVQSHLGDSQIPEHGVLMNTSETHHKLLCSYLRFILARIASLIWNLRSVRALKLVDIKQGTIPPECKLHALSNRFWILFPLFVYEDIRS